VSFILLLFEEMVIAGSCVPSDTFDPYHWGICGEFVTAG
jgi:hypothetical protein